MNTIYSLISGLAVVYLSCKYGGTPATEVPFGAYLAAICASNLFITSSINKK